jgi:hypothetical protein
MLGNPALLEVWCETFDDITLIWGSHLGQHVEFVQVKSDNFGQFWSIARLCQKESVPSSSRRQSPAKSNGNAGIPPATSKKSILERSLDHDCYSEEPYFRIVTIVQVNKDLEVLVLPIDHSERSPSGARLTALVDKMKSQALEARSPNGRDYVFWLKRAKWDIRGRQEDVANANILALRLIAEGLHCHPTSTQLEELYNRLLKLVKDASDAPWLPNPSTKKITRDDLASWLENELESVLFASPSGTSDSLKRKMTQAKLCKETIQSAVELRQSYLRTIRQPPSYLDLSDRQAIEAAILYKLQRLRSQLYSGEISQNGVLFHNECLKQMESLCEHRKDPTGPQESYYAGCMYEVTNRCSHRFDLIPS